MPSNVTQDYVHYLRSTDILIGGEMDKILSIVLVITVLIITLTRARKQLVRSVAESQEAQDLSRFFSPEIAEKIAYVEDAVKPGEGVECEAAILFVDLRGFTALAARIGPNQTVDMLSRYQKVVVPMAQAHGGSIDKFMGDGVMIPFGAAALTGTYAADAVNLAAKLEKHCKVASARLSVTGDALLLTQRQGTDVSGLSREELATAEGAASDLDLGLVLNNGQNVG